MHLSRSNWLLMTVSLVISIVSFYGFFTTLPPIPEPMHSLSGTIASATSNSRRDRISIIRFVVSENSQEFSYPDILGRADEVWGKIDQGVSVQVSYTGTKDKELWGLRLNGETVLTPEQAYRARRKNGYWALGLGIGFLSFAPLIYFVVGRKSNA